MSEINDSTIGILIDPKKRRIRIFKSVLHLLGNPKYIQLLVNPRGQCVAIRALEEATPADQAEKVKPYSMLADCSYELYSKAFVEKLCEVVGKLDLTYSYRMTGKINATHHMAVFSMKTLTRLDGKEDENGRITTFENKGGI